MATSSPDDAIELLLGDVTPSDQLQVVLRLLPVLGLSEEAVFLRDMDSAISYWSAGAERLYGWRADEARRHISHELLRTEFPTSSLSIDTLLVQDGKWEGELIHQCRDGTPVVVESRQVVLRGSDGKPLAILESDRDITQRRRAERVRYELAAIVESSDDAIIGKTLDATVTSWNQAAERLFGYRAADIIGRSIAVLYPPDRADELPGILERLRRGERIDHYETERIAKDGRRIAVSVTISPIRDDAGQIIGASDSMRDITERVQMQRALEDNRARMRLLAETSAALASSLDYETTLSQMTRLAVPAFADRCVIDVLGDDGRLRRMAGFQADPAANALLQDFLQRYPLDPEGSHPAAVAMRTDTVVAGQDPADALLISIAQDAAHLDLLRRLQAYSYIAVPLVARGQSLGVITFYRVDPSLAYGRRDLRLAEDLGRRAALAMDNARLYRDAQEALRLRDEFLSSISHDLRTPLTTIFGTTQLVLRQLRRTSVPEVERPTRALANVERAALIMTRMVDQLLDLSRLQFGRPLDLNRDHIDLVALVRQHAEEQQRGTALHRIRVVATVPTLEGFWDALRIERVLDNLLSNAVKYSPDGGAITVTVSAERDAAPSGVPEPEADWAVVTVEDEGIGIPAAELPVIFERFRRGSNVPRSITGAGIGLAGSRQIIEQHGGTLTATSEEGTGSRFTMRIPITVETPER